MSTLPVARRTRALLRRTYDFNGVSISRPVLRDCERAVRDALHPYRDDVIPYLVKPLVMETISRLANGGYLRGSQNARPSVSPHACYEAAASISDNFEFILYSPTPHDQKNVIQHGATAVVDALFRNRKLVPLIG